MNADKYRNSSYAVTFPEAGWERLMGEKAVQRVRNSASGKV